MPIDFELSKEQLDLRMTAREFAQSVLRPIVEEADREPDPHKGFQMTREAYRESYRAGMAYGFLPSAYGGGDLSTLDYTIAAEELCAVDPGIPTTILVNGLGLLPVLYWGTEEQKERFFRAATSDEHGDFLVGYAISEPPGPTSGSANFDTPLPRPTGIGVIATREGDEYVLNGRKYWPCNVAGWDLQGADLNLVVVRTDPDRGGTEGISALMVERGTPGVSYQLIDKSGHRLCANAEIVFDNARVPADNLIEGTRGNADLLINRNFAWSGPIAGIAAVGNARAAYEYALEWAKNNSAGGANPIIQYQNVGYVLGDVAARIEAGRYFCWKAAHYIDYHDYHGELIGAMCKTFVTELMFDCVYKCMQVVGVNSVDLKLPFHKFLREAAVYPLYDGGNFAMQRRRVHGILADDGFDPRALAENRFVPFTKEMEGIDTIAGPSTGARATEHLAAATQRLHA
jgi:acyl-CoA dehydrogenase